MTYLSKSQNIRGLQCHKALWLYKNQPELRAESDASQQSIFDAGTNAGILARDLIPGGKIISFEGSTFEEKLKMTRDLIESGVDTVYEATFEHDNVLVMVDILHRGLDGWEIYEVKSSTEIKDVHLNDLALQFHVLNGAGLNVSSAFLVHINNEYVREDNLEISKLFKIVNVTEDINEKIVAAVPAEIIILKDMLIAECPKTEIGEQCEAPYPCDFIEHCWAHIPKNSIFDLRGHGIDKLGYYKRGIIKLEDLNLDELNAKQRMQVESELFGIDIINQEGINDFLGKLHYPMFFLDFETFRSPIPPFAQTRPYEQIPFQFSLHSLERADSELSHYGFLAKEGLDERERLARELVKHIPEDACIVTYNMGFEKGVIRSLAKIFPSYASRLMAIHDSIVDLMIPFQRRDYYTREMRGSYSLKAVLPALVPELTYEGLQISNGGEAEASYSNLHMVEDSAEVEKIRSALEEYCRLDTLALVKLLEKIKNTAGVSTL
jgi:hypothetical protein